MPADVKRGGDLACTAGSVFSCFSSALIGWRLTPDIPRKEHNNEYKKVLGYLKKLKSVLEDNKRIDDQLSWHFQGYLNQKLGPDKKVANASFYECVEDVLEEMEDYGAPLPGTSFSVSDYVYRGVNYSEKAHFAEMYEGLVQMVFGERRPSMAIKIMECVMPEYAEEIDLDTFRKGYKKELRDSKK